jgi:AcrR family transcriptional regulator
MGRWEPGTRGRLQDVAYALFAERGFETVSVADIARGAEVTERTFYRYFGDKREVLFDGQERLRTAFVHGVAEAPAGTEPLDIATYALDRVAGFFPDDRREGSRARQVIIDSDPGLRERELLKITALAAAVADALRERGVGGLQADLVADAAISVFRIAFVRWISEGQQESLGELQRQGLEALRGLTS